MSNVWNGIGDFLDDVLLQAQKQFYDSCDKEIKRWLNMGFRMEELSIEITPCKVITDSNSSKTGFSINWGFRVTPRQGNTLLFRKFRPISSEGEAHE